MKKSFIIVISAFILFCSNVENSKAQSARLIGENILNGALTGTILGTATMGLQDDNDFTPLRVGLGAGILAGTGMAIYDVTSVPKGQQFFISGLFNDGTNSSVLILLDTLYGASVGAAVGSAIVLIGNQSILDGLQFGASAGAWAGFGLGLVDSFVLAEKNDDFVTNRFINRSSLFQYEGNGTTLSFIQPGFFQQVEISKNTLGLETSPSVHLISFQKTF